MSTHDAIRRTHDESTFLRTVRIGALAALVLVLPAVTACTDTVTGLDRGSDNGQVAVSAGSVAGDSLPVAQ